LRPKAKSVEVKGGFRVKGSFDYGTGSSLARWLMVPAPLPDRDGRQWFRAHVLPKENAEIKEDSWDAMGLRATASVDYSITDTFVPTHRTSEYPFLADGNPHSASAQGLMRVGQIGMTAFASGISIRALAELIAAAPNTRRLLAEGMQAEDNVVQFGIGEFEGRLHAARRHYIDLLSEYEEAIGAGREPDADHALGTLQTAQILARAARDLTVFAFDNAGTNAVLATEPLQRCLRDIFTGLKHAALTPAILTRIGKVRLGLDFGELRF
jgi:indole-3-acetate monooxygenase